MGLSVMAGSSGTSRVNAALASSLGLGSFIAPRSILSTPILCLIVCGGGRKSRAGATHFRVRGLPRGRHGGDPGAPGRSRRVRRRLVVLLARRRERRPPVSCAAGTDPDRVVWRGAGPHAPVD